jgi:hypothetical protein
MIGEAASDVVRVVLGLLEQCGDMVVVQVVLDLVARPPHRPDQAAVPEEAQLMGHGGFACAHRQGEVPHAEGSPHEGVEDLRPGGIAEGAEGFNDKLKDLLLGEAEARVRNSLGVDRSVSRICCHRPILSVYLFRCS